MLNAQKLMDEAARRAGLSDFGDGNFRPRLERLVESVNRESRLLPMGEVAFPELLIHALENRLQIEDWYRRHPEIDDETIDAPVFIVGMPRTGSTLLSYLLALDPETRLIRQWESEAPCPPPVAGDDADPRIAQSEARHDQFVAAMPEIVGMVPYGGASGPVECYELFYASFDYAHYDMFVHCPSFTNWWLYESEGHDDGYRYHQRILKLLQWRCPGKRWVLKMPSHTHMIGSLLGTYPDARFIMTHRDPASVIPSTAKLNYNVRRRYLHDAQPVWFGEHLVQLWDLGLRRLAAFRDQHADRFFDVYHHSQLADSPTQMRRLYEWLEWPCSDRYMAQVEEWRSDNPRGDNRVDLADFGLDKDALRFRFAHYTDRYPEVLAR